MDDLRNLRGGLLARNTVMNLIGPALPLVVAVFAVPLVVRGLGIDRFGVLTLTWTIVGYMGLFDIGLGRALTHVVAERIAAGERGDLPVLVWTCLTSLVAVGILIGCVAVAFAPWLVKSALKIPGPFGLETLRAFYLIAAAVPFVTAGTGLRGILEAIQEFGVINAIRVPSGLLSYISPLAVLPFSHSLVPITAVLVAGRVALALVTLWFCLQRLPELKRGFTVQQTGVRRLLAFSGWVSVSNAVNAAIVYLDRFLIGALVSVASVAYYGTPFDMVSRLWLIPTAVSGVLFPAFAATFGHNKQRTMALLDRGLKYLFIGLFPVVLILVAFAGEGLSLWLGADFARHSARILQWLSVAVFLNSMDYVPFALLQGMGRPDVVAKWNLAQLPPYVLALWFGISSRGPEGAAIAWVLRTAADTIFLLLAVRKLAPESRSPLNRVAAWMGLACASFLIVGVLSSMPVKAVFVSLTVAVFVPTAWFAMLEDSERSYLQLQLRAMNRLIPARKARL
jgi:O-antigen/teichoic acid export membrane protein